MPAARIAKAVFASTGVWTPLFRPDAIHGIAAIVAISAPTLAERDRVTLGKLGAWICGFDDAIDGGELGDDELALRIAHYRRLVRGREATELAFDPIACLLAETLDELAAAPLADALWPLLAAQLEASCEAMRWERAVPPGTPLEAYLDHGSDSVFIGFVVTAAAMLYGEPATPDHLPALLSAQRHAAIAVRIANDLATWTREQAERSAANALQFAGDDVLRARGLLERQALERALDRMTAMPALAAFLRCLTDGFLALYARGDLTDVTVPR